MSIAHDDSYFSQNAYASPAGACEATSDDAQPRSLVWLLFSFEGRIPRRAYWLAILLASFGYTFAFVCSLHVLEGNEQAVAPKIVFLVSFVLYVWINLAANAKRWHDRDKSAAWLLIGIVPIIGGLWQFVELGFLPGTPGRNRYGAELDLETIA